MVQKSKQFVTKDLTPQRFVSCFDTRVDSKTVCGSSTAKSETLATLRFAMLTLIPLPDSMLVYSYTSFMADDLGTPFNF